MADAVAAKSLPINVRRLTKSYGSVRALDEVDLDVRSGEFLTLLGPSGSGKTTLLMVLVRGSSGPTTAACGSAKPKMIRAAPHRSAMSAWCSKNYALFPHMTVAGNIAFPRCGCAHVPKVEAARQGGTRAGTGVQLPGYGTRRVSELSGGQRQRVALARAIVFEPRILLMDEPLSALDKHLRDRMQIELRSLHERLGMTTVYVTHDQREALTMSDRVAVIDQGRIIQLDTPRTIYQRPANRFVAEFIGESTFLLVNEIDGTYYLGDQKLKLPEQTGTKAAVLMLRPELLHVLDGTAPDGVNLLRGHVRGMAYQGDSVLLQVELTNGTVISVRSSSAHGAMAIIPQPGEAVTLGLPVEDTRLLPQEPVAR